MDEAYAWAWLLSHLKQAYIGVYTHLIRITHKGMLSVHARKGIMSMQVGSEVARRARGLGMTIIAHDPFASEAKAAAIGVRLVSLNEALGQGDFFSLHMPLTAQTKV